MKLRFQCWSWYNWSLMSSHVFRISWLDRKKLGTRLFLYKNMSDGHEIAFLCKLRLYLGSQYSTLIEEMKNDILLARQQKVVGSLLGGTISGPGERTIDVQSFDLYLNTATRLHTRSDGLSFNQIVEEFFVPWGTERRKKAKYTDEGYSIFGGMACLLVNAHVNNKSWNGRVYTNMFFLYQGQVHLFPWAMPKFSCTSDTASNDFKAFGSLLLTESSLRTRTSVLYPLHLESLCNNLKKLPRGSALGLKTGAYVRCHPAFLRHSQRSCIWWHLKRYDMSKNQMDRIKFRALLQKITSVRKQWHKDLRHHPLFASTFETAQQRGVPYGNGAYDLYRFLRDWHTHCHQKIAVSSCRPFGLHFCACSYPPLFQEYTGEFCIFHLCIR